MSVIEEIVQFCKDRDPWQQDALRRLLTVDHLGDGDIRELLGMLKTQFGITEVNSVKPLPVEIADVPQKSDDAQPVILNSVGDLINTNRLATGQVLPFAIKGLTIVYGDNGSGKSGYCRILKKLCRVREGGEEYIRGDAFTNQASRAEASVRFTVGEGEPVLVRWTDGQAPPPALARISVFDARTVPLYADHQNRVQFLPHGLDLLMRLAEVSDKLSTLLAAEQTRLHQRLSVPLPSVPPRTSAATLTAQLTRSTPAQDLPSSQEIKAACDWTEGHVADLAALGRELLEDPNARASRALQAAESLKVLQQWLDAGTSQLSDHAVAAYRRTFELANTARNAALLAADHVRTPDLLPGFGSEPWRLLFQHARRYSEVAYDGKPFPVTGDGARCVLCQQSLTADAATRLTMFDRYIQSTAEAEALALERQRDSMFGGVQSLVLRSSAEVDAVLAALAIEDTDPTALRDSVRSYLGALVNRKRAVLHSFMSGDWESIPVLSDSSTAQLEATGIRLIDKAADYERKGNVAVRSELDARVTELRARKILATSAPALLARRDDLDTLSRLNLCLIACDTTAISRKNSDLRKQYLTKDFRDRLEDEILEFDLSHIPFKIQERSDRGASFLGIGLETTARVKNHEVLSDGEFRALAIACFLTEIGGIAAHDGIIVDDPVSSLDHLRTVVVAKRLVREAEKRQVIIFTHDLVFYHELCDAAAEHDVPVVRHWIRRSTEQGFGTISQGEEPWQAKNVAQRLDVLARVLARLKSVDQGSGDVYRRAVKDFYTDVRETWERLVEELLFNGAVTRFQLSVKTQSIAGSQVTDDDHKKVFYGMKRASSFSGHDRARGAQTSPPRFEEMERDVQDLRTYAGELRKRRSKIEAERRKLEKPIDGTTA
jgi:energy-coupling factor transporter ATP-binding protein EcfA2